MVSIRQLAECVDISGTISVCRDFLGFFRAQLPSDPTGATVEVSLLRQARLLKEPHFNVNIIAVGSDMFTHTGLNNDRERIDYAIYKIRNIYDQINVGVGRIQHIDISVANADGLDTITDDSEPEEITDKWYVANDGIDVFIPFSMNIPTNTGTLAGRSPQPGPCEGKDAKGMNGVVVGLWASDQLARTFAHEIGHYLGLRHNHGENCADIVDRDNLMAQSTCANSVRDSVDLTNDQRSTVEGHCLVKPGC
jgi:hypothetical protein